VGSLGRVAVTVESLQKFTRDLWLVEATSTDDEAAVSQGFVVGATANRE
jgi:hypothetical protein